MKTLKTSYTFIILLLLILNLSTSTPDASTPHLTLIPDHFNGEIFPNSTVPLQLSHTNTIITKINHKVLN
ncbi:MAG: hypothetical protein ACXABO_06185 [Promethearchaeota archaeon]|jgi:hypothetical protein